MEKYGPRNYSVLIDQDYHKCHIDQLRYRHLELTDNAPMTNFDDFPSATKQTFSSNSAWYPTRTSRHPPNRLTYFFELVWGV